MKSLSWNIRGLRKKEKRGKLRKLIRDKRVDFLLLQETKLSSIINFFINSIWDHSDFGFLAVDANETAGGLVCIWNSNCFKLEDALLQHNFSFDIRYF